MEIKNIHTNKKILLADSTSIIDYNEDFLTKFDEIISFDLETHRILRSNSINHKISEDFFSDNELLSIDSACMNFCQWYKENNGDELLSYEKINLGSLFSPEFNNFLIPFLKKKMTLDRIITKYPETEFFCTNLIFKILKNITNSIFLLEGKHIDSEVVFGNIKYNITNSISINLSNENFLKLKKISEKLASILIKKKISKEYNIALIEFDQIKYQTIFQESNESNVGIFLYNRRRPIIYNQKSFKIIKKSHAVPYINHEKFSKKLESNLEIIKKRIHEKSEEFFNNDEFFHSFFKFQNVSFWNSLKPLIIEHFNSKISKSLLEIEIAKEFLIEKKPGAIIVLSENGMTEQIMLELAKKLKIKTVLLQHGAMLTNSLAINFNKIIGGVLPIKSSNFFVWGKNLEDYSNQLGFEKITKQIGSPNLDRIFLQKKNNIKNTNDVLLLLTGPRNQQYVGHDVNVWDRYEIFVKKMCEIISKNNFNIIIKRHPDFGEPEFSDTLFKEFPKIKVLKQVEISDLLLSANVVISVGYSTSIFEAQILEKPVISVIIEHDVYGIPETISKSCLVSQVNDFEQKFLKLINDNDVRQQIIENANKELKNNFHSVGNASKEFFDNL